MIRFWLGEYKSIAENQGAFILLVGAVVLYSFLYPVPYHADVLREVPVAVVDNDFSELSRKFARMLDANENIRVASRPADLETARQEFLDRKVYGIVVIPEKFERDIRRGEKVTVSAYYDTSTLVFFTPLKTGVSFAARTLGAGIQIRKLEAAGLSFAKAKKLAARDSSRTSRWLWAAVAPTCPLRSSPRSIALASCGSTTVFHCVASRGNSRFY
ncbi:MAG: ABC transporter permease [Candidatus Hydrogenedentes bacterium]|nr:ABC transporter permease [Candidatus Hydrogenedentota bacterium]